MMLEEVGLTIVESRSVLHRLEVAMVSHEEWLAEFHRALLCGGSLGDEYMAEDAHERCRFGLEVKSLLGKKGALGELILIQDILFLHQRMHDIVRRFADYHHSETRDELMLSRLYDEVIAKRMAFRWMVLAFDHNVCFQILHTDPLTNTLGREKLLATLQREIHEIAKHPGRESLIVMVDVDYFKRINDTYGHVIGDRVLIEVSRFIKTNLRPTDLVFRYGGEEFVLFLSNTPLSWAGVLLERLRQRLSEYEIVTSPLSHPLTVTASFGVAQISGTESIQENVDRADKAMYQAKRSGRNRVVMG
ncbi:MAG: sensor domain-containing diguanylate cyclase [Magnetococcales bacterium]|nr:sensor domain-containing diguanylate cyclase [Magnetococcales bacterium]